MYGMAKCSSCTPSFRVTSCTVDSNGKHHSYYDNPAITYECASQGMLRQTFEWHCHGKLHRTSGPAVEWNDGEHEWIYKGWAVHRTSGDLIVGDTVSIGANVATVLRHLDGCIYEILLGNKKVPIVKV